MSPAGVSTPAFSRVPPMSMASVNGPAGGLDAAG
jgi:hypothetical protein